MSTKATKQTPAELLQLWVLSSQGILDKRQLRLLIAQSKVYVKRHK
jgi:hypothetical protein